MDAIQTLKSERAALSQRAKELADKAQAAPLIEAEQVEFDAITPAFEALGRRLAVLEGAQAMSRTLAMAAAAPVDVLEQGKLDAVAVDRLASDVQGQHAAVGQAGEPIVYARPRDPAERTRRNMSVFSGIIGALKHAPGNLAAGAEFAQRAMSRDGIGVEVAAALSSVTASGGAVLIPNVLAATVIERLVPNAVVRSMGPLTLPLTNGNLTMPRIAGGALAGYIGRDSDAPVSQQAFDDVQLVAKKLACLVPIGNDLIRFAGIDERVDQLIVEDTAISMATAEDAAFIRGDGTNATPVGLRNWCLPANVLSATPIEPASGTPGAAPAGTTWATPPAAPLAGQALAQAIMTDAGRMVLALRRANVRMRKPGWLMHPDSVQFLRDLLTTTGNRVFPEIDQGMFRGYPFAQTTQIPTNLSTPNGGGNCSEIYFVDFAQMVIGESLNLSVAISQDGAYTDPTSGTSVSAFQRDLTLIRLLTENDFGPRHPQAIAVLQGVTWYR